MYLQSPFLWSTIVDATGDDIPATIDIRDVPSPKRASRAQRKLQIEEERLRRR